VKAYHDIWVVKGELLESSEKLLYALLITQISKEDAEISQLFQKSLGILKETP